VTIPLSKLFAEWRKDTNYLREYDALEGEFAAFAASIRAEFEAQAAHTSTPKSDRPELVEGLHSSSCVASGLKQKDSPSTGSG
jgi:hypothetical protein